jgi:glycosyltransferase involved in cell wall biosynthesis
VTLLGNGAETVRSFVQTSSVWPIIEHLGPAPLEQRVKFFKQADLFVLPTYAEGMPVAVLEAMAAGLPVITTRVGGIPELIEDGVEGFLIAPGDVEALADRITRLIRDPSERRRMSERGQAKARNFDEKLFLARLGAQLRLATDRTL